MLFTEMQELETRFVRQSGMSSASTVISPITRDTVEDTVHLLSDLGSLALLLVLSVDSLLFLFHEFRLTNHQVSLVSSRACRTGTGLFDGEFFIGLDSNLSSFLQGFLLDESHLNANTIRCLCSRPE